MNSLLDQFRLRQQRHQFFLTTVALIALLAVALGALVFNESQTSSTDGSNLARVTVRTLQIIVAGLIGGAVTAGYSVFMFNYLYKRNSAVDLVDLLDAKETKQRHLKAAQTTSLWYHNGHIGRWVRVEVIPRMIESALSRGVQHTVILVILDPKNSDLARRYSEYRTRNRSSERDRSTPVLVKLELLATIVAAAHARRSPNLNVRIYFRDMIGWTRLDMSDDLAFRTNPGQDNLCVAYRKSMDPKIPSEYDTALSSFEEYLILEKEQAADSSALDAPSLEELNKEQVSLFLEANDLSDVVKLDNHWDELREKLVDDFHPYR